MTCIAASVHKGVVWMGADAMCTDDKTASTLRDGKVFRKADMLLGCAGDFRWNNLLQHVFSPPQRPSARSYTDMKYLVGPFVDALHRCVRDHSLAEPEKLELALLIGYRGGIYYLDTESYDITRCVDDFDACGSGQREARAVLAALDDTKLTPRTKILRALTISARYGNDVRGPFKVLSL